MKTERIQDQNSPGYQDFRDFTANGPKGHILQSYEWGEVKEKTGWTPIRFLVREEDETVVAAASVLKRKMPGMNRYLFYVPRGPVMDFSDDRVVDYVLGEIKKLAKEHNAFLLKIDPDLKKSEELTKRLKAKGMVTKEGSLNFEGIQPKFVFRLDISDKTEEELLAQMDRKTRYNIRLAEKKGVTVREAKTKEDLHDFYRILKVTAERDRFQIRSEAYFEWIWDSLVKNGLAKIFLADYENEVISGTLAGLYGDKVWYMYGASDNRQRDKMPNYLLQWTMIKWAKEENCNLYDFRGVSGDLNPGNPLYGLYRFKKGFKGEFTEFVGEFDLPYSKFLYFSYEKAVPFYKKIRRRLRGGGKSKK